MFRLWDSELGAKILIVDDEEMLVEYLRQTLLPALRGCEVDAAYSGEEALSKLADTDYDLILADLRMPGFDGLALVKGVRYLDPHVPIVLMTGFGSKVLQREAADLGVDHYLEKPFETDDLLATVRRLLPRAGVDHG